MADQKEYGDYQGDITNRQKKRWKKTSDYASDNYNQNEYNPEMVVHVSPAGHITGHDNTKGKERQFNWHMTGSGYEILKDGSKISKTIGNHWDYKKGGTNETTQGNSDVKNVGHTCQNTDGGAHTEVKGNSTTYIGESSATHTVGNSTTTTTGATTIASEKALVMSSKGKGKDSPPVSIALGSKEGTVYVEGAKHIVFKGAEDYMVETDKVGYKCSSFSIDCSGEVHVKGSNINQMASGDLNLKGAKVVAGPKFYTSEANISTLKSPDPIGGSGQDPASANPKHTDHFPERKGDVATEAPVNTTPTS